jgi:DNA-binding MarR family transcriptional regulator
MSFNETVHQPVRLRIMSALCTLPDTAQVDFSVLRQHLHVTDGNLGAHLRTLDSAGFLEISKTFVDLKPRTRLRASEAGRAAFLEHVLALQEVIRGPSDLPVSET